MVDVVVLGGAVVVVVVVFVVVEVLVFVDVDVDVVVDFGTDVDVAHDANSMADIIKKLKPNQITLFFNFYLLF